MVFSDDDPVFDPDVPSDDAPDVGVLSDPPELSDAFFPSADAAAPALAFELAVDRSFLAHPEPLKWTAGVTNAFRSVSSAPHAGQNRGAGASIPWMNSVRVEHVEQT